MFLGFSPLINFIFHFMKWFILCKWFQQWIHKSLTKFWAFKNWHFSQRDTCFKECGCSIIYWILSLPCQNHISVYEKLTPFISKGKRSHLSPYPGKKGHIVRSILSIDDLHHCRVTTWKARMAGLTQGPMQPALCQDKYPIVTSKNGRLNIFYSDILGPHKFLPKFFWVQI